MKYKNYITDLHLNLHPYQINDLEKWYEHCKKVTDFFTIAYYPYQMIELENKYKTEEEIDKKKMLEQWNIITEFLKTKNKKDDFISFIGYEWQGSGVDGDHNIYFKEDYGEISLAPRYQDLVKFYKNQEVIGIPHHLAYSVGNRGKNWETHDEDFSPFVETYSHHGSSERDQTNIKMERHIHMGPRVDGSTVVDGLKKGYHFGLIASGDNHEVPALVKNGRAGVWAQSYTKESIWEALRARRTFGFTDSKISVWSELEGQPMGSIVPTIGKNREIKTEIIANNKIERIELFKNTELEEIKVIKTKIGSELNKEFVRFKFKLECGWGPNVRYFPNIFEKNWQGILKTEGKIISVESVFNSFDNDYCISDEKKDVKFKCLSQKATDDDHWMRDNSMKNEGFIFEIEAPVESELRLRLENEEYVYSVKEILEKSHLIVFEKEAKKLVEELSGLTNFERSDGWYHNAYKIKIYQGFTNEDYEVITKFTVKEPIIGEEDSYFIKVIQSDGQVAWGSPIWLNNKN